MARIYELSDRGLTPAVQRTVTDDGIRLWAALNMLRRSALDTYTVYAPGQDGSDEEGWRALQRVGWSLLAVAAGLSLLRAWAGGEAGSWLLLAAALCGVVAVLCLYIAVQVRRSRSRRRQARAVYLEGEAERSRYRAVLARLASSWRGGLTEAGISTTVQFLTEHWPAAAPFVPMRAFLSYGEDRLTVTGQVAGHPALVQTVDFWPPLPAVTPPLLVLFVAGQPEWPEPSAAGEVLTRLGLQYGRNRAGTWAIHRGPATAVLTEEPLGEIIDVMVRLSGPPPSLRNISLDPWRIGKIVGAALARLHFDHARTT